MAPLFTMLKPDLLDIREMSYWEARDELDDR